MRIEKSLKHVWDAVCKAAFHDAVGWLCGWLRTNMSSLCMCVSTICQSSPLCALVPILVHVWSLKPLRPKWVVASALFVFVALESAVVTGILGLEVMYIQMKLLLVVGGSRTNTTPKFIYWDITDKTPILTWYIVGKPKEFRCQRGLRSFRL